MTGCKALLAAPVYGVSLAGICIVLLCGCGGGPTPEVGLLNCLVLIDGKPVNDVRVTLSKPGDGAHPMLVGVTDYAGVASMTLAQGAELPSEDPIMFRASVESLGDWYIAAPWSHPAKSPLEVSWNRGTESVQIDLPRKAVKSL